MHLFQEAVMRYFCKKNPLRHGPNGSDFEIDPNKLHHGHIAWAQIEGMPERVEVRWDAPTRDFVSPDKFKALREKRAERNRKMFALQPQDIPNLYGRGRTGSFVR